MLRYSLALAQRITSSALCLQKLPTTEGPSRAWARPGSGTPSSPSGDCTYSRRLARYSFTSTAQHRKFTALQIQSEPGVPGG